MFMCLLSVNFFLPIVLFIASCHRPNEIGKGYTKVIVFSFYKRKKIVNNFNALFASFISSEINRSNFFQYEKYKILDRLPSVVAVVGIIYITFKKTSLNDIF